MLYLMTEQRNQIQPLTLGSELRAESGGKNSRKGKVEKDADEPVVLQEFALLTGREIFELNTEMLGKSQGSLVRFASFFENTSSSLFNVRDP